MNRKIGFVGCYSHDVILMLAIVLCYMKKKVLIRDRNRQQTLQASIPIPDGLCAAKTIVEYNGFFFTGQESDVEEKEKFDIEIIDYGMDVKADEVKSCSELILVTDMLLHHIRRLKEAEFSKEAVSVCIMRDAFEDTCRGEREVMKFLQSFPNRHEYFLPPDFRDVRNRYVCETSHEYNVHRSSPEMQEMLYHLASKFCTEKSEKEIRRCVKQQKRRQYQ